MLGRFSSLSAIDLMPRPVGIDESVSWIDWDLNEAIDLIALVLRGHFVAFSDTCYPAHITALVCKDIERILTEAGFSVPEFIFTNVGWIPKFPKLHW